MARGDSIIRVSIIGDAQKLVGALGKADDATGGLLKSAAKIGGAGIAIDKAFDFVGDSLGKADDFNDAFTVLEKTIGKTDAQKVKDIAFSMTDIGLSADEVGTLAVSFGNFATASGVAAPLIADLTPDILDIAAAIHAQSPGQTLDQIVSDIGKAAGGSKKPVADLGVVIDSALNPDEQLRSILDQLKTKYGDAKDAANDFAGAQEGIGAKWDNLMIKIGDALDGPLQGVLDWISDEIDGIPAAIDGFDKLELAMKQFAANVLGPLGNVRDVLANIIGLFAQDPNVKSFGAHGIGVGPAAAHARQQQSDAALAAAIQRDRERNGRGS